MNGQSRESGNQERVAIKREWQSKDTGTIGHKTQNEHKQNKAKAQQNTENTYLLFIHIQVCKRM